MSDIFESYGYAIGDTEGNLRDTDGILIELKEIHQNFSTHAMSDHVLFLRGKLEMLSEVIEYLERV